MPILPNATTTFSGLGAWAQPMFDGLLPYGYLEAGIILGVGLIIFLIGVAGNAVWHMRQH